MVRERKDATSTVGAHQKSVVMEQLLKVLLGEFESLEAQYPSAEQSEYRLRDCLGMMLSVLVFKYPSLLHFTEELKGVVRSAELGLEHVLPGRTLGTVQRLFQLSEVPSDTTLRRRLDVLPTAALDRCFEALMAVLQQWELWSEFATERGELLLVLDGTQVFASKSVHCTGCRETHHRDDRVISWSRRRSCIRPAWRRSRLVRSRSVGSRERARMHVNRSRRNSCCGSCGSHFRMCVFAWSRMRSIRRLP